MSDKQKPGAPSACPPDKVESDCRDAQREKLTVEEAAHEIGWGRTIMTPQCVKEKALAVCTALVASETAEGVADRTRKGGR